MPLETVQFEVRDHLATPGERAAYIEAALETEDLSFIAVALGDVANATEALGCASRPSLLARATARRRLLGNRFCRKCNDDRSLSIS